MGANTGLCPHISWRLHDPYFLFSSLVTLIVVTLNASTANSLHKSNLLDLASRIITLEFKEPASVFFNLLSPKQKKTLEFYVYFFKTFCTESHLNFVPMF